MSLSSSATTGEVNSAIAKTASSDNPNTTAIATMSPSSPNDELLCAIDGIQHAQDSRTRSRKVNDVIDILTNYSFVAAVVHESVGTDSNGRSAIDGMPPGDVLTTIMKKLHARGISSVVSPIDHKSSSPTPLAPQQDFKEAEKVAPSEEVDFRPPPLLDTRLPSEVRPLPALRQPPGTPLSDTVKQVEQEKELSTVYPNFFSIAEPSDPSPANKPSLQMMEEEPGEENTDTLPPTKDTAIRQVVCEPSEEIVPAVLSYEEIIRPSIDASNVSSAEKTFRQALLSTMSAAAEGTEGRDMLAYLNDNFDPNNLPPQQIESPAMDAFAEPPTPGGYMPFGDETFLDMNIEEFQLPPAADEGEPVPAADTKISGDLEDVAPTNTKPLDVTEVEESMPATDRKPKSKAPRKGPENKKTQVQKATTNDASKEETQAEKLAPKLKAAPKHETRRPTTPVVAARGAMKVRKPFASKPPPRLAPEPEQESESESESESGSVTDASYDSIVDFIDDGPPEYTVRKVRQPKSKPKPQPKQKPKPKPTPEPMPQLKPKATTAPDSKTRYGQVREPTKQPYAVPTISSTNRKRKPDAEAAGPANTKRNKINPPVNKRGREEDEEDTSSRKLIATGSDGSRTIAPAKAPPKPRAPVKKPAAPRPPVRTEDELRALGETYKNTTFSSLLNEIIKPGGQCP